MLQLTEPAAYANQTKLFSMNCNSSSTNNDNNKNKGNCSHPNLDAFLTCRRTSGVSPYNTTRGALAAVE